MRTIAPGRGAVTVGIDTHADVHVAAALDPLGRVIERTSVATTPAGHAQLLRWTVGLGSVSRFGVQGTGSYGAQLARDLRRAGHEVVEVDRPDRKTRRLRGTDDTIDAEAAARAVRSGTARRVPKTRDGQVEAIRALRVARRNAVRGRTAAVNQIRAPRAQRPGGAARTAAWPDGDQARPGRCSAPARARPPKPVQRGTEWAGADGRMWTTPSRPSRAATASRPSGSSAAARS
jgi:hypothetical protein